MRLSGVDIYPSVIYNVVYSFEGAFGVYRYWNARSNYTTCSSFAAESACAHIAPLLDTVLIAVSILVVRVSLLGVFA